MAAFYDYGAVIIGLRDLKGDIPLGPLHAGVLLTGGTGSGKTSSVARLLMTSFLTLRAGAPRKRARHAPKSLPPPV